MAFEIKNGIFQYTFIPPTPLKRVYVDINVNKEPKKPWMDKFEKFYSKKEEKV